MIQERAVTSLYQRVGWRQPTIDVYDILDAPNMVSLSGKYFDDFNVLASIKNIKETIEDPSINPSSFNKHLKYLQEKSIRFVLESVFTNKVYENKSILSEDNGNSEIYVLDPDTFYGIEINLGLGRDVAMQIKQIGFYFDTTNAAFNLHLFHSNSFDVIKTWSTVTTEAKTEVFTDINETIYAFSQSIKGGKYYLGFRSEDVVGSPINRQELMKQSCIVGLSFIRVPMTSLQMFNTDDVVNTSETYFNLEYSSESDFTELIISNKASFDHAIGLQHAVNILEIISNTTRSNSTERNLGAMRVEAHLELHGNTTNPNIPYKVGVLDKLHQEIVRLRTQFNHSCRASAGTLTV